MLALFEDAGVEFTPSTWAVAYADHVARCSGGDSNHAAHKWAAHGLSDIYHDVKSALGVGVQILTDPSVLVSLPKGSDGRPADVGLFGYGGIRGNTVAVDTTIAPILGVSTSDPTIALRAAERRKIQNPKIKWSEAANRVLPNSPVAGAPSGAWWSNSGTAADESERVGAYCDAGPVDMGLGCVAVWVADRDDAFTAVDLPDDQKDNFLNTLYYNKAWLTSEDGMGLRAGSLPIAGPARDWDPVCYVAELVVDGVNTTVLGYEEPNGDKMLPCGGAEEGFPFTAKQIESAGEEELQVMCEYCYRSVCGGRNAKDPRSCGGSNEGGVDIGPDADEAHITSQVSASYHCHLTMADEGACDFVHYDQHVSSRNYLMESGVVCGWERITELQLTSCDCTRKAGTNNGCRQDECLDMAVAGVVCGNCNGCSRGRAYEGIFDFTGMPDPYEGTCGTAHKLKKAFPVGGATEAEYEDARRLCAKGLFCREGDNRDGSGCEYYCGLYGDVDTERCTAVEAAGRKLLSDDDGGIPYSAVRGNPIPRRLGVF
eukprot:jgi/Tetstr1/444153/TSEL_032048.t1